ncbi:MAG: TauD/TfdA family dioxygenase [Chitinophagaceae bacterium]|nr:TauD/TfdA family dioxygenase [Chitinophagaceae bacterium]
MENRLSKLKNAKAENIVGSSRVEYLYPTESTRFPLMIRPKTSGLTLTEWGRENMEIINNELNIHGALLFRGFNVDSVKKFQDFISVFDLPPLEYKQRTSPRYEVAKNIYHSTTYPSDQCINMHSENSYALNWAMKIVFCCINPAEMGGETPIADNRLVYNFLSPLTKEKFKNKGVRYVRTIGKGLGLSWEEVFQTNDRAKVEEECSRNEMQIEWKDQGKLVLTWNNKAIYDHPITNEKIWFNHSFFFNKYTLDEDLLNAFTSHNDLPFNTYFGDGTEISRNEIDEIREAYDKSKVLFPWIKGDVLYLDNMLFSHGRSPYKGTREILVSMF